MKKYLLLLCAAIIALASCTHTATPDQAKQAAIDDSLIRVYLKANPQIKAIKDPSGIYYQIITPGKGANPTPNSEVTVNYAALLLNDNLVDRGDGFNSSLDALIKGWQIGIPLIKEGGSILLIVPSGLAYGGNSTGRIPENAILKFNVDLVSFR